MEWDQINKLMEYPEEIKAPADFTLNLMKEIRRIKVDRFNPAPLYRAWGISLIASAIALMIINVSGFQREIDYNRFLEKSTTIQRNITLSVDETSRTIQQIFNNIIEK